MSSQTPPNGPGESTSGQDAQDNGSNAIPGQPEAAPGKKRRNHRGGRKKKTRRQSFAATAETSGNADGARSNYDLLNTAAPSSSRPQIYRLGQSGRNLSDTSLDSQALLDHRDHPPMRARRDSRLTQGGRPGGGNQELGASYRQGYSNPFVPNEVQSRRRGNNRAHRSSGGESEEDDTVSDSRTPLLAATHHDRPQPGQLPNYMTHGPRPDLSIRRPSTTTSTSSKRKRRLPTREPSNSGPYQDYDVNNPPSVPNSPILGADMGYDDVLAAESFTPRPLEERRATVPTVGDQLIDIDGDTNVPGLQRRNSADQRRRTIAPGAEEDVCFPLEGMSELADDEYANGQGDPYDAGPRRRSRRQWPDLSVLEEWSREEKEERSEGINRAKKISEPVLVGGRLRPQKYGWHRAEEDAPYRFTYFNEEFQSTIHSQTISELQQPGQSFGELFVPDPPELSDYSSDEDDLISHQGAANGRVELSPGTQSKAGTRQSSILGDPRTRSSKDTSGDATPNQQGEEFNKEHPKRYGARPTFWLDVLSPTDTEMRIISKAFGIHPLTAEDIMMQEAREKVELFRNYYFVNYRTFEQDMNSEDYLEPVNMYIVVFREGVISFHFSMTPHPANVRRRIRQLKDYLILSSDWISYAIIDDITDVFAPLIQSVEDEVDDIDDAILELHSTEESSATKPAPNGKNSENEKQSEASGPTTKDGGDMLRRVGQGRKKVMGLYRLLGNKADVIKGFAKRCNEQWEIAPRSEIGLYLGDIQDHILTMTSNLGHYETLLSRAHSNYLAQINIRMNERQEQTADVLGKLTVLGTIVLPMNIITGMWGMNVLVPGQDVDNLYWFWSITAGLLVFGVSCFFIAKRVYGIV